MVYQILPPTDTCRSCVRPSSGRRSRLQKIIQNTLQNVCLKRPSVVVNVLFYCSAFVGLLCSVNSVCYEDVSHVKFVTTMLLSLYPKVSLRNWPVVQSKVVPVLNGSAPTNVTVSWPICASHVKWWVRDRTASCCIGLCLFVCLFKFKLLFFIF